MNLLYVDESGSGPDPRQSFFVLAGVSVFEKQCFWIDEKLNEIAARFNPNNPKSVELHGNPMLIGKKSWRRLPPEDRIDAIQDSLKVIADSSLPTIFACVIRKAKIFPQDPVEIAFEQLASRFDYYLKRLHKHGNSQKGIMIFDKSSYETIIQKQANDFRINGHTWEVIRNLAEVPLFLDSKASRLTQLADLVAYSIYRHYEHHDSQFYSTIAHKFDREGDHLYGLYEII
ncbi:MAG: DUF3800 domain-containing protein [Chitinophagaceae bacterium]|nr:DUF3800 domain-containing protein [Chitinophagaceae bacterium]